MDLATKFRNTNVFTKVLLFLASIVFIAAATVGAVRLSEAFEYCRNDYDILYGQREVTLKDCVPLSSRFDRDIVNLNNLSCFTDVNAVKAALSAQKDDYLRSVLADFAEQKANRMRAETEYYEDEDVAVTSVNSDGNVEFNFFYNFEYGNSIYEINNQDYNVKIYFTDDEKAVTEKLNKLYESFIENHVQGMTEYNYTECESEISSDLFYYVITDTGEVISNLPDGVDYKTIPEMSYSIVIQNGEVQYSKELEGALDNYSSDDGKYYTAKDNYTYYLYFEANADDLTISYSQILNRFYTVSQYNVRRELAMTLSFFVLACIIALILFIVSGKRLENGKVKRAWVDKIPSDLHILLSAAAAVGLFMLFIPIADNYEYISISVRFQPLLNIAAIGIICAVWSVMIECITSFIRVCKSEKRLIDNLLCIILFRHLVMKPIKAVIKSLRYKPENFNKNLKRILIAYGAFNFICLMSILFSIGDDEPAPAVFMFILNIGVNAAAVVFAVKYAINLDRIISAAQRREIPQVDYNSLPESLKTLCDSIQYTSQELEIAVTKAVRDERMRTELITNVSHDLKTPLTSIITYVDLLKGCDIENGEAKEYIAVLDEKGGKLKRLIDDLIEASKITSGVINLNPVNLSLNELAAQAVFEKQQEFIDSRLELVFKGDKTAVSCFADGNKTFRILDNLLSNARKYSAKGTRVYCDVFESGDYGVFEIKNISAEPLDISAEELTERFVRGDKSRNNEGNGLGLSIAENLCKAQGGELKLTIDGDLFKAQVILPKAK